MTIRLHVYSAERTNEVVRRIRLWSDTERIRSTAGGIRVRVGVASGDKVKWLGGWSQFRATLPKREYLDLTGIPDLNFPLERGDVCVIEVTSQGVPGQSTQGMAVEWKFARVGGVSSAPSARRLDGSSPYPRPRDSRPLFSLGTEISDPEIRGAVQTLEESLNTTGVTEWVLSAPVPAVSGDDTEAAGAGEQFDYGRVVVPGGAPTALLAAPLVIQQPDPAVPYRLQVTAGVSCTNAAPGTPGYGEIYLQDLIQGLQVAPAPAATPGTGAKIGVAGSATPALEFAQGAIASAGYIVPAGTPGVSLQLYGTDPLTALEYHDPWVTARFVRDPYVV